MLTPNYLQNIPNAILDIMHEVELDMLASLGKRMSKFGKISGSMEWQILKAQQLGILRDDLTKNIAKYSNKTLMEVQRAFNDAGITAVKYLDELKSMAVQQGLEKVGKYGLTNSMVNILQAGADRAKNIQNLTNTKCVQNALKTFTNAMDKAYLSVSTGILDVTSATRQAMNEIANQGISIVEYTSSGKMIKYSIEGATRRNIITSVNQTTMRVQKEYYDTMECGLVETSSHAGARPEHAIWQGRVFYWGKPVKGYDNFETACGYGEVDGIGGINCYHSFFPFYEGLSQKSFSEDPSKDLGIDNDKQYEMQQKQRILERQVRQAKKELAVYKDAGSGFENEIQACKDKISQAQYNVRSFVESNNKYLSRDYSREAVASAGKYIKPQPVKISTYTPKPVATPKSIFNANTPDKAEIQAVDNKVTSTASYTHIKNTKNLNILNQTVYDLDKKYQVPSKSGYFKIEDSIPSNSISMAQSNGQVLRINPRCFDSAIPPENDWVTKFVPKYEMSLQRHKADLHNYTFGTKWYKEIMKEINKYELYTKCTRWTVDNSHNGSMANYIKRLITHEYGHTISDRYFGMINPSCRTTRNIITDVEASLRKKMVVNTFTKAKMTGDITKISAYACTDSFEFFAEAFAMREAGEVLPDYILKMLEEVLRI